MSRKYLSNRQKSLNIGVSSYTENEQVLGVIGNVSVSGIVSASEFIGDSLNISNIDVDGQTELDDLNVSGISTFAGAIDANGNLDVDGITELDITNISETLNVSGVSTFASDVDINASIDVDGQTELDDLNVSGVSTFAGAIDANGNLDVDGHTELDTVNVSIAATIENLTIGSGIAVTTILDEDDMVSNSDTSLATQQSIKTYVDDSILGAVNSIDLDFSGDSGIGTVNLATEVFNIEGTANEIETVGSGNTITIGLPNSISVGQINSGVVTASSFVGDLTGTATTATNLSDAANITTGTIDDARLPDVITSNINSTSGVSTFANIETNQLTIGSGIAVTTILDEDDMVSNSDTSLATQQSIKAYVDDSVSTGVASVELDFSGDSGTGTVNLATEVFNIEGTPNEIETVGSGVTVTIGLPDNVTIGQDLTITRDVNILRNLDVTGNITVGGTSATLFTTTLEVEDPDIVLGIRTDAFGNDISTDNTANHGGIAIASTDGSPLVNLNVVGIETLPPTYKKIMWFKSGTFAGLATDAWLSNYAFGVGTTQISNGTRLAVGNIELNDDDITAIRNIDATGIITASSFVGDGSQLTNISVGVASIASYADVAGIATYATNAGIASYADVAGIATYATNAGIASYADVAGIATVAENLTGSPSIEVTDINATGVSTFQSDVNLPDSTFLRLGDSGDLQLHHDGFDSYIRDTGAGALKIRGEQQIQIQNALGTETYANFNNNGTVELYYDNSKKFETTGAGVTVFGTTETQQLNVTGVSTFQGNVNLGDNNILNFGDDNDLQIFHDGTSSYIRDIGTGGLVFVTDGTTINFNKLGGENLARFLTDGAVELYYDNSKKFETTGAGVTVFGTTESQQLNVSGVSTFQDDVNIGVGGTTAFFDVSTGRSGIGTDNPVAKLDVLDNDIQILVGDISEGTATTDGGVRFNGIGTTIQSALFTELNGVILSYGINVGQITAGYSTDRVGGIFRLDTRTGSAFGDSNNFVVKGRSIGTTIEHDSIVINLDTGETSLSPDKGNVGIGTNSASQLLDVNGDARFRGAIYDNNNVVGTANSILVSTGSGVVWADPGTTVGIATNADLLDGLNSTQFLRSDVADTKVGVTTFQDDIFLGDDDIINLGDGNDLQIRHRSNGDSSITETGEGQLYLGGNRINISNGYSSDFSATFNTGVSGEVGLYYGYVRKFETTGAGVTVFGTTETQQLNVSGVSTLTGDVIASSTLTVGDTSGISGGAPADEGVLSVYTSGGKNSLIIQTSDNNQDRGIAFRNSADAYIGYISIENLGSNLGAMVFGVSNATENDVNNVDERLRITKDGELGVGTITPTRLLDVDGAARFRTEIRDSADSAGIANYVLASGGAGGNWSWQPVTNVGAGTLDAIFVRQDGANVGASGTNTTLDFYENFSLTQPTAGIASIRLADTINISQLNVSGVSTFQDDIFLGDNDVLNFGDSNDLQIFHNSTNNNSIIQESGSGNLVISGSNIAFRNSNLTEDYALFTQNGSVELYYDNSLKFETTTTGIAITNGASTSATIAGPDEIIIDPATVGDNTGSVRIKGDLFVDGTQTIINSSTIELADFIVGIASTATTDTLADGAGIKIGPDNTFLYEYNSGTNPSLKSSENLNVASGKVYQIAETERLSANTLSLGTGTTIHSPASNILTFGTNGDERVRIDNVGDVTLNLSTTFNDEGVLKFGRADGLPRDHYIRVYNDTTPSGNYMKFQVHDGTGGGGNVTPLTLFGDSKVGINTDSATQDLDVNGNIRLRGALYDNNNTDGTSGQVLTSTGSGVQWITGTTAASGQDIVTQQAGTPYYITGSDITSGVSTAGFINSNVVIRTGDLGLGTNNPTERVDVEGTDGARVAFTNTGTRRWTIGNAEDASTSFTITDQSASSEKLRIDINGDVGIGTDNPGYKLQVEGDIKLGTNGTGTIWFDDTSSTVEKISATGSSIDLYSDSLVNFYESDANALAFTVDTNNARAFFENDTNTYWHRPAADTHAFVNNGSESVRITSSGSFGIGTNNPQRKLHVNNSASGATYLQVTNADTGATLTDGSLLGLDTDENLIVWNQEAKSVRIGTSAFERMRVTSTGDVGIGTDNPGYKLEVNGSFAATTKSFVIDHPTKEGMKLRYGSLEGPENGVYVRGRLNGNNTIELPDYWTGLVDEETITVNLTPIGRNASLHSVIYIVDNTVVVESASGEVNCFYTVFGERKDVEKLEVEF